MCDLDSEKQLKNETGFLCKIEFGNIYWRYLIVQPLQEKIRIFCMGESTTRPMGFIIYIFLDERWYSDTEILGGVVKV